MLKKTKMLNKAMQKKRIKTKDMPCVCVNKTALEKRENIKKSILNYIEKIKGE